MSQTEKPKVLISLLEELLITTDKSDIGEIIYKITLETNRIKFYEIKNFSGLILKRFCHLVIMNYVSSSQSSESVEDINELILTLEYSLIFN